MNTASGLEQCLAFINCQVQPADRAAALRRLRRPSRWRAVTISRQTGSGGHEVARRLAGLLQMHSSDGPESWTVWDRNLIEKVLEDHHLPNRLAKFMPEDRVPELNDTVEAIFGLHPPSSTLVEKTAETIRRLAEVGNVVLLGRGANIITGGLEYVFHVRLMGSLSKRAEYIQETRHLGRDAALELIRHGDMGQRRYVKKYFGKDIEDPSLYHLVINTDVLGHEKTARLIADAIQE